MKLKIPSNDKHCAILSAKDTINQVNLGTS